MSIVPALDLAEVHRFPQEKSPPANIEAEQAVLGAVLYDNEAFHLIEGLESQHFFEPFHGLMWAEISAMIAKGRGVEVMLLHDRLLADGAYAELGGVRYLADLVDRAPPAANAPAYAAAIMAHAQRRELIRLGDAVGRLGREGAEEPAEIISFAEAQLLAMQQHGRKVSPIAAGEASARVLADLDAPPEVVVGVKTGIDPLDDSLGPLLPGDLLLLMGRPSMGKSAAAGCIALNMARAGWGVLEINGEMTAEQMTRRHLADLCHMEWGARGPKYSDMRKRAITHDQRRYLQGAHELFERLPLVLLKRAGLKLSQLRSLARRQAARWARTNTPFGALIIDHVGLLHPDQPTRDRYADQTIVSNSLKELAEELACPIIGLNQMNRQNENREDKRPQLSDLRDSGSWEQDADFVIGFYREAYYAQRQAEPQITKTGKAGEDQQVAWSEWDRARRSKSVEAIILKAREGETTTVKLWADVARNAIRGVAPEDGDLL